MIIVIDYGVGNLQSVVRMLRKAGADCKLSSTPAEILSADKIILPGVGNFGHCVDMFRASPAFEAVGQFATELKRPTLGICVGAQMLGRSSEEAPGAAGLGWLDMDCRKFSPDLGLRIPNMGWNQISLVRPYALLKSLDEESRFYFVHSYHFVCHDPALVVATANYGIDYPCVVEKDNIVGIQFHPEKSLRHGLAIMTAFASI